MELGLTKNIGDFSNICGYEREKRVMEVAASGMHPLVFCGLPDDNIHTLMSMFYTILPDNKIQNSLSIPDLEDGLEYETFLDYKKPCPCGNLGGDSNSCTCSLEEVKAFYKNYIKGDLIFFPNSKDKEKEGVLNESSQTLRSRIEKCWEIQASRFHGTEIKFNAQMGIEDIKKYCVLDDEGKSFLNKKRDRCKMSGAEYYTIIRIARTISDMEGVDLINLCSVVEALGYRSRW
jgi:predicted ATPase with chaperone activity